jgi:ketoreductase RED1
MTGPTQPFAQEAAAVLQHYNRVAVVGAGLIGSSWAALFLAHGLQVNVFDPRPDVETLVHKTLEQATPALQGLGLSTGNLARNLSFHSELESAIEGAALVQESGLETLDFKQELFARMSCHTGPQTLLVSSSSTFRATDIARDMADPGRMLIGHPFNPPYLIPLVELVPGERTSPATMAQAMAFYRALGKRPVALRREIAGFVINRLQAVLFAECIYLVKQGVATVDELDEAISSSVGLRWAVAGPMQSFHVGGGAGGLRHFLEHIGPPFERLWKGTGTVTLDEETIDLLSEQANQAFGTGFRELASARDKKQLAILKTLRETGTEQEKSAARQG